MSSLRYFDQIQYGSFDGLEVLVSPDDNQLWVTQPTIERVMGYEPNNARKKLGSKSLKAFAGKDLTLGKSIKSYDVVGKGNTFKAVPFDTFLQLIYWEAFEGKGDPCDRAKSLLMAGFADSFRSIVLEQCGIKLSVTERNITIDRYLNWYHSFQDWVRDTHVAVYGSKPDNAYYQKMARLINDYLFAKYHFRCDRKANASTEELRVLENFQMAFMRTKMSKTRVDDPVLLMREYINAIDL